MTASALHRQVRNGVSGHPLTLEQEAIIAHPPTANKRCIAFAGCGKTTSSVEYTHAWKSHRALYLAFNSSIAAEAKGRFPAHVRTQTAHAYAYQALNMARHRDRIVQRLYPNHLDDCQEAIFPVPGMSEMAVRRAILRSLNNFLISGDDHPSIAHLAGFAAHHKKQVFPMVSAIIERFMDFENTRLAITHDVYLKAFAREGRVSAHFDYIIVDEAQDLNPVLIDIVRKASRPAMLVGDPWQSIYNFRGAVSAMQAFDGPILPLSQSFRFGPEIAEVANNVLQRSMDRPSIPIVGFSGRRSTVRAYTGTFRHPATLLARTNFRLFEGLAGIRIPFHVVGGIQELLDQVSAGYALFTGKRPIRIDPLVSRFKSWDECQAASELDDEPEVSRLVKIIEEYGHAIPTILEGINAHHQPREENAAIVVSTAHKAKGREWQNVIILDDFQTPSQLRSLLGRKRITVSEYNQEINLLYVAATRAIDTLSLSQSLHEDIVGSASSFGCIVDL